MTTVLRINRGDVRADKQTGVTESLVSKGFAQLLHLSGLRPINIMPRIDFYTCQLTYFTFDSLKTTLLTSVKASLVKRSLRDACLTKLTE